MIEIIPNWHPALVHFPIAFITAALVFLAGGALFRGKAWAGQWTVSGHWLLWSAALFACIAAVFGWLAFNSVEHDDVSHVAMVVHRNWALTALAVLVLLAVWDAWRHRGERIVTVAFLILLGVAWLLVMSTAWHGAELVYRHGLGVMRLPEHHTVPDLQQHDESAHSHTHSEAVH